MIDAAAPPLCARGVRKSFVAGGVEQRVLDGVDLQVESGEAVGIVGASGAGKSTLLHISAAWTRRRRRGARGRNRDFAPRRGLGRSRRVAQYAAGLCVSVSLFAGGIFRARKRRDAAFYPPPAARGVGGGGAFARAVGAFGARAQNAVAVVGRRAPAGGGGARARGRAGLRVGGRADRQFGSQKRRRGFRFAVGARARRRRRFGRRQPRRALDRAAGSAGFFCATAN